MVVHQFLVYGLTDPRTGEIRYVGKSAKGMKRPQEHGRKGRGNGRCKNWVASLAKIGLKCGIEVLECCETLDELSTAEVRWIKKGRDAGWRLTNLTDGGEGAPGHIKSPATRRKLSQAAIERQANPEVRERIRQRMLGHEVSEETREKIRLSLKGRKLSKTHADNIQKALKGRIFSEEHRKKLSDAASRQIRQKGRVFTEEHRRKLSEAASRQVRRTGRIFTEEHRRKLRESASRPRKKGRIFTEEHKQNLRESLLRTHALKRLHEDRSDDSPSGATHP